MTPTPTAEVFPFSVSFCLSTVLSRARSSVSTKGGGRSLSSSRSSPSFSSPSPTVLACNLCSPFSSLSPPPPSSLPPFLRHSRRAFRETLQSRKRYITRISRSRPCGETHENIARDSFSSAAALRSASAHRFRGNLRSSPKIEFPDPTQPVSPNYSHTW